MLISPAYAQASGGAGAFDIMSLLPLILIFVVFYFLLIRPQQKKVKEHRTMLSALRRGDKVVTNGGIIGQITKVLNENELELEIADGIRVRAARGMISSIYARTEAADDDDDDKSKDKGKDKNKDKKD